MSHEDNISILKKEYGLDIKSDSAFFQPRGQISEKIKSDVKNKYNVYLKNVSGKIRVSNSDSESRIKAIIELVGMHNRIEENDSNNIHSDEVTDLTKSNIVQEDNNISINDKQDKNEHQEQQQQEQPQQFQPKLFQPKRQIESKEKVVQQNFERNYQEGRNTNNYNNRYNNDHNNFERGRNSRGGNSRGGRGGRGGRFQYDARSNNRNQEELSITGNPSSTENSHEWQPNQNNKWNYDNHNQNYKRKYDKNNNQNKYHPPNQKKCDGGDQEKCEHKKEEQKYQRPRRSYKDDKILINVEITPELKHIFMLMDNQITAQTSEQEILSKRWFHLEKINDNPNIEENGQIEPLMNESYLKVSFLIESFATDQPEQFRHLEHKNFEDNQIMHLKMPFLIPLSFQSAPDDKIQISYFNNDNIDSFEIDEICSNAIATITQRSVLAFQIKNVKKNKFSLSDIESLSKELDFIYLHSVPEENNKNETMSFTLKILEYNWSPEKEAAIKEKITQMFNNSSVLECRKCGSVYSASDSLQCYKTCHKGKRIPFPESDEMEIYDIDDDGQPAIFFNYECCGKVEADAPGCVKITDLENGNHEPYEDRSSKISTETMSFY